MQVKRADARKNQEHLVAVARAMAHDGVVPTFNALAREAGVGVGTVYRHFEDEQALASAIVSERLAVFQALIEEAHALEDASAAFSRFLRGSVALVLDEPLVAQVFSRTPSVVEAVRVRGDAILKRAKRAKTIRTDLTLDDVRRLVCGIELAARSGEKPSECAARYLEIVIAGLAPKPRTTR